MHFEVESAFEFDPAFQDVDQLEGCPVEVGLAGELLARCRANDMGDHAPVGRLFDAQVAIFVERTQTAFKLSISGM